jgi:hypothetical protein
MEIDPVKYGVLWQKVQDYERRFDQMETKIDKMEVSIEKLVALANQGVAGFGRVWPWYLLCHLLWVM